MHKQTYLSVAQSRAWGLEYPIGDPFGGAPYGQRAMPVVAVVAAAASIATGVGMVAAAGGLTMGAVLGGALVAGGALTIVGTVTGNQKLTKIGSTLSLVGGIGAFGMGAVDAWNAAPGKGINTVTGGIGEAIKGGAQYTSEMMNDGFGKISESFGTFFGSPSTPGNTVATSASADLAGAPSMVPTDVAPNNNLTAGAGTPTSSQLGTGVSLGNGPLPTTAPPAGVAPPAGPSSGLYDLSGPTSAATPTIADLPPSDFSLRNPPGGPPMRFGTGVSLGNGGGAAGGAASSLTDWVAANPGSAMMGAGMLAQAGGAYMSAAAAEKQAELANARDQAEINRINSQIMVATTKEDFDRLDAQGAAVIYMPPISLATPPAGSQRPPTTSGNFNIGNTRVVSTGVPGAVATGPSVVAPTFKV